MTNEQKLREALQLILPLAKGYAAEHNVGSNAEYVRTAEEILSQPTSDEGTPANSELFYLCDTSLESGTGDDSFVPVMDTSGYATKEEAYLAAFDYVSTLAADDNRSLQIRSRTYRSEYFHAYQFRGTFDCPICGMGFPHCHSRKEVADGTVDIRTSKWWPEAFEKQMRERELAKTQSVSAAPQDGETKP